MNRAPNPTTLISQRPVCTQPTEVLPLAIFDPSSIAYTRGVYTIDTSGQSAGELAPASSVRISSGGVYFKQ